MRGFQPAAHLVPKYADGGLVQRALGLFGGRKKQIDEAVKVASQDTRQASAPAPAPVKTTPDGKFDEKRASNDNPAGIGFADGGMVSGGEFVNPLAGIGDYWSKSNAEFEAQGPSLTQRALRSINPVTGLGSAVGAMHDGASKGSAVDMSIAALQAMPVFGVMRAVAPAVKSAIGAVPAAMAPSAAGTAARVAKNVAAGVVADEAQEGNYFNGFANGGMVRPRGFVVGPGTETSDSIPARLSAGEYVLPADTVKAVGVDQLDALREATHKPVKGEGAKAARGFFVGGTPGGVKEEDKPNFFPGNSPDAGAQIYKQPDPVNADTVKVAAGQVADAVTNPQGGGRLVQGAGELFANRDALKQQARERVPQPIPQPAAQAPVAKPAVAAPPVQASVQENAAAPVAQSAAPSARAQYVADQNAKLAAANQQLRAATQAMNEKYKPANTSPTNTFPANQLAQPKTPASAEVQKPAGFSYQDNNQAVGMDIKDSWNKGNYGEAFGKTVAGTVGMFSTPIIDGGLAAWDGAKGFGRGLLGVESPPGNATPAKPSGTTPKQDATASTPTPATATLNSVMETQRRRDAINGTGTNTNDAAAPPAPESQGREVVPGAYAHGRGQYSDQAGGMGFSPGFTGKPNAQNDAAAEALSARSQQEFINQLAQQQYQREVADAQAINAAGTRYAPNSGLQYQWMNDIRDPRTMALRNASAGSTIFRNKGEEITANKARQARVAGVQQAINDRMHDAQQAETTRYQSDNTLAGYIATEQMRQDGANTREAGRNALTAEELGLKREAAGFQTRAAQQLEQLRNTLIDPKATPEQRAVAQRNLAALSGKTAADRMQTVTLPDTTNEMGQVVRGGQALVRVLEDGTVQQVPIGAQQGAALPPGMKRQIGTSNGRPVYEDMNGKQVIAKG